LSNLDETYSKQPLVQTDDLVRFWRSKVKVTTDLSRWWRMHPRRRLGIEVLLLA